MKLRPILLTIVSLLTLCIYAQDVYTPDNLPKVHIDDMRRYVCNPAGILSQSACDSIDSMLYALEQKTGIETVVAVVPSIGETSCFDFCHELLNSWGVGKKGEDNGLVVLLVIDQRQIQFYTGYGLEGILPDALCKRIQVTEMQSYLKDGHWNEAMTAGMKSVCNILNEYDKDSANSGRSRNGDWESSLAMFIGLAAMVFMLSWIAARKHSKCPNCGKHTLQRTNSQLINISRGVRTEDVTYTCTSCGYSVTRRQTSYENNSNDSGSGPIIFGSGGSIGGGFGGSFGGGSGGGGGAGTRF